MQRAKPSLAYAIFCLALSALLLSLPGSAFPKENWLDRIWFDKWVHIGIFAILVILWCWTFSDLLKKKSNLNVAFIIITILMFGYGIAMEFVQQRLVSNRSFDVGDIIADAVGCISGLFYSIGRYIKK